MKTKYRTHCDKGHKLKWLVETPYKKSDFHRPDILVPGICDGCKKTFNVRETTGHCGTCYADYCEKCAKRDKIYMPLTGFISTSLNRAAAEGFAWSDPKTGHMETLF